MDKTLEMYEIAVADGGDLDVKFCEDFTHPQYLVMYRALQLWGQDTVIKMLAGFLDPEGSDEDRIDTNVRGETIVHRGDLGTYGYWKALPEALRTAIAADNK